MVKKLLREPLVHFLLLGAAIFAAYSALSRDRGTRRETIVVTQGKIESLATTFARTWQRPPTDDELAGLVRGYVREEVAAREAVALGLDREDTVIRRRLQQKLDFVSEDLTGRAEPTEEELRAYLREHAEAFRGEPRLTFRQVYLSPERRRERLAADAAQMLAALRKAGAAADLLRFGDPLLLEHDHQAAPASEVRTLFGEKFASALGQLPVGEWQGPVESGYGAHLVLVREHTEGKLPVLEEVRDAVRREWANARRLEAKEKFYQALLERYTVTIEEPRGIEKKTAEAR